MDDKRDFVESLARGLSVLRHISERPMPPTLTELSEKLGLSKSAVQRLTFTLQQLGYVGRDEETRKFVLGSKCLSFGFAAIKNLDIRRVAYPIIEKTAREINETVNFGLLTGTEVLYVERVVSPQTLSVNIQIGSKRPLYCTSMGKAMLAFLPEKRIEEILEAITFIPFTVHTITKKGDLRAQLKGIRRRGFAVVNEELELGIRSVAAPVRDYTGAVIAAVNIAVPTSRVSLRTLESKLSENVTETARRVSLALGCAEDVSVNPGKEKMEVLNVTNANKR